MTININKFQRDLKIKFKKKSLLFQALTHKSADHKYNNEKLEFLGDRVIGLVLSRKLFDLAVVKVTLEYKSPAKIDALIDVQIRVQEMGSTSMVKRWEIYRSGTNKLLASGETISVNYESVSGESRPLPDEIRRDIETYEGMLKTP